MNLLLDTHALLWMLFADPRLKDRQRQLIEDPSNRIYISAVSVFEIATKVRIGKLPKIDVFERDIARFTVHFDYVDMHVTPAHAALAGYLDGEHRDPFDRLLAAQSIIEGMPLITSDSAFAGFRVTTIW